MRFCSSHLHPVPRIVVKNILIRGVVLLPVKEGGEGVPLVVLTGSPEDHDHAEDHREEKVPESLVHPEIPPLGQTVNNLVILDTPEHEDDAGDNCEDESVGEVLVEGELDKVSPESECSGGLDERRENPPGVFNIVRVIYNIRVSGKLSNI